MSTISEFSRDLTVAVETAGAGTVTVDARKRYPASGLAYAADLVLTAEHVVTREDGLSINAPDGKAFSVSIAGSDPGSDLTLLRLAEKALSPAKAAELPPKVGQLVLALGRPSSAGIQASWGIITAIGGPTRTGRGGLLDAYIRSETTSYPGFSGGPLVNTEGEVLGLNTSGLTRGGALTIPAKMAWRIADSLANHGTVKRGYLGVRTQSVELQDSMRQTLQSHQENGLLVLWIEGDSPAANAGVLIGDILIGVGGIALGASDDLFAALGSDTVGQTLSLEVIRGGQALSLKVTVGDRR